MSSNKIEHHLSAQCCFCGTIMGALVQLRQGWCCLKCFNELLEAYKN
jgi:hypothetical protein